MCVCACTRMIFTVISTVIDSHLLACLLSFFFFKKILVFFLFFFFLLSFTNPCVEGWLWIDCSKGTALLCWKPRPRSRSPTNGLVPGSPRMCHARRSREWPLSSQTPCPRTKGSPHWNPVRTVLTCGGVHHTVPQGIWAPLLSWAG